MGEKTEYKKSRETVPLKGLPHEIQFSSDSFASHEFFIYIFSRDTLQLTEEDPVYERLSNSRLSGQF